MVHLQPCAHQYVGLARNHASPGNRQLFLAEGADHAEDAIISLHRFLANTGASLIAVKIEDPLGQIEQKNVPGTMTGQPNWRRKLSHPIETIFGHKAVSDILAAITDIRGGPHE